MENFQLPDTPTTSKSPRTSGKWDDDLTTVQQLCLFKYYWEETNEIKSQEKRREASLQWLKTHFNLPWVPRERTLYRRQEGRKDRTQTNGKNP